MSYNPHSSSSNLLSDLNNHNSLSGQISSDEPPSSRTTTQQHLKPPTTAATPSTAAQTLSSTDQDLEEQSIWKQSAHPVALLFLFSFRCAAIATYLLCGFFSSSYVFSVSTLTLFLSVLSHRQNKGAESGRNLDCTRSSVALTRFLDRSKRLWKSLGRSQVLEPSR